MAIAAEPMKSPMNWMACVIATKPLMPGPLRSRHSWPRRSASACAASRSAPASTSAASSGSRWVSCACRRPPALDLVHVVDPFVDGTVTPEQTYFRLHGVSGARHVYTDDELRRLRAMLPESGVAYVMFNNIPRVGDAERFRALL